MAGIEITDVRIYPFDTHGAGGKTLAMAQITIGGAVTIRGFRIIEGKKGGVFLGFPSTRGKDGQWRDIVLPVNNQAREMIREAVMEAFRNFPDSPPD
ncbi:MAG: SpoVG family protein [Nitrospinota bacterium]|nr:SpoVG family protein [Nitrospinota bacterium]